jgi:hypothetical protein
VPGPENARVADDAHRQVFHPTLTTSMPACSARAIMSAVPRRREMFLRRFEIDYKLELSRRLHRVPARPAAGDR